MRGKRADPQRKAAKRRSIPACAGEARWWGRRWFRRRVYPRVCGGSFVHQRGSPAAVGLSPRVRGRPQRKPRPAHRPRSIPACAGEARARNAEPSWQGVYPRVCGGSSMKGAKTTAGEGLSPRVRGKPGSLQGSAYNTRSIPACAGEAARHSACPIPSRVYPRVCGGSHPGIELDSPHPGLSPRVRGKPRRKRRRHRPAGSIPACAGEATTPAAIAIIPRVYPRVCGGSAATHARIAAQRGLSPRVRGKRYVLPNSRRKIRSIPACAGEA